MRACVFVYASVCVCVGSDEKDVEWSAVLVVYLSTQLAGIHYWALGPECILVDPLVFLLCASGSCLRR